MPTATREQSSEYRVRGWTVVPDVLPREKAYELSYEVDELARSTVGNRIDAYAPKEDNPGAPYPPEIMDEGGFYAYSYAESDALELRLPEVTALYEGLVSFLTSLTREAVIVSPYKKSRVLGVSYHLFDDRQGYHRDTQPITALLYLSNCRKTFTRLHDFQGNEHSLQSIAGSMLVMQGRHIRHCSTPLMEGDRKVVLPMNYYTAVDTWRPQSLDSEEYWGKP